MKFNRMRDQSLVDKINEVEVLSLINAMTRRKMAKPDGLSMQIVLKFQMSGERDIYTNL